MADKAPELANKNTENPFPLLSGTPSMLPKWCNRANLALIDNKCAVLSLAYYEGMDSGLLIERVAMDTDMMRSLRDTLNKAIEESEKNEQSVFS